MEEKKTTVINLFGGPGTGKSTAAAYIFSRLKMHGIDCEYVTEFAKDKVWEDNKEAFKNQFYIGGKQSFKISRCCGKVDIIVTDSPILLSAAYENDNTYFKSAIFREFNKYNNHNIYLNRDVPYDENGRNQTEEEAVKLDKGIKAILDMFRVVYSVTTPSVKNYEVIIESIVSYFNKKYVPICEELNK